MSNSSDPMDYSPPGSSVQGIFQAKVLEWGATAFSGGKGEAQRKEMWKRDATCLPKAAPRRGGLCVHEERSEGWEKGTLMSSTKL